MTKIFKAIWVEEEVYNELKKEAEKRNQKSSTLAKLALKYFFEENLYEKSN
jgi:rRNA-processing protein FCF1